MLIKVGYGVKAVRIDKFNQARFLYQAHEGSSLITLNRWLKAKARWVTDGSRQKKYRSGFHYFRYYDDAKKFNKLTKGKYFFFLVKVKNARPKPRSKAGSWLAGEIFIHGFSIG